MIDGVRNVEIAGNRFSVHSHGDGPGAPLILLHGFLGSAAWWNGPGARWAASRTVFAVDLPGHGETLTRREAFGYARQVAAVAALINALSPGRPAHLLGYSMGGRLALGAAVQGLHLASLVLVSTHPGLAGEAERAARACDDAAWARRLESLPPQDFFSAWNAQAIFAHDDAQAGPTVLPGDPQALAAVLRGAGLAAQPDFRPQLKTLRLPVLLAAGAHDAKFAALAAEMHRLLPASSSVVFTGAGHRVPLSAADFSQRIADWLANADRPLLS